MKCRQLKCQSGMALVISLVMLTLLTLLGVSNMSSSTIDIKMASNSQAERNSFQASLSAINWVMSQDTIDYNDSVNTQTSYREYGSSATGLSSVNLTITPIGISDGATKVGESLGGGAGKFLHLQIRSEASFGSSSSVQVQGVSKRVAGG